MNTCHKEKAIAKNQNKESKLKAAQTGCLFLGT